MKLQITKILIGFTTLALLIVGYGSVHPVKIVNAACNDIPYGFVTASISITDVTTGNTVSGLSTSFDSPGSASMDYTEGGDVYIEITGGGNSQQDNPVYVQASGFNSNQGNNFGGYSYGNTIPSFSQTFTGFSAGSVTVTAEQCPSDIATFTVYLNGLPTTPTFNCAVVPASATVNPGSNASFSINTTAINGFNSPVTFSSSFSPSSGTLPTVSLVNNGQTPPATTTATVSTTQSTTSATYTITFSGTGGGQSGTCNAQFVVNPPQPDFSLVLSPLSRTANIGTDVSFQVFANCTGGLSGPITGLTAATTFQGIPTPTLAATTLACGATTTVTVTGTASIPDIQQSTILNTILESVTVTGNASG